MEETMSKSEIKVRAQDHFKSKINRLVKPQIQREELKLKADINVILDKGSENFSKKIGADKVIQKLEKATEELEKASRLAHTFFGNASLKNTKWKSSLIYNLGRGNNKSKTVSVKDCYEQLNTWAEEQAKEIVNGSSAGKKLQYLKAIQEKAEDMVEEANSPKELSEAMGGLFQNIGIAWDNKLPALPHKKQD